MNLLTLCNLIQELTGVAVYPAIFPADYSDILKVEVTAGELRAGGVVSLTAQIMAKAHHPAKAEELTQLVKDKLDITDYDFRKHTVILARPLSEPFYVGESKTGSHIFSIDIHFLIDRTELQED